MRSNLDSQGAIVLERSRVADYVTLTKPELTFLSVVTALAGFYLGTTGAIPFVLLIHTLVGTALLGAGAGALNQYLERKYDAMMHRTEHRPLPSGRLTPLEVLIFGSVSSFLGILELTLTTNALTGFLSVVTLTTYLFLYTPLKRITPFATVIGGIPGALPPLMGWTAVRGEISAEAFVLFAILFFWQMPHFLSLAWMYRKDYARAGYRMLTVLDPDGGATSRQILLYCVALIPATLMLSLVGRLGQVYFVGALLLGFVFLWYGLQLFVARSNVNARRMFFASLLYLPTLVALMVLDTLA